MAEDTAVITGRHVPGEYINVRAVSLSVNLPLALNAPPSNQYWRSRYNTYIALFGAQPALHGPTAGGSHRMISVVVS